MLYKIIFSASHYDSLHPSYKQGYEAFDLEGSFWAQYNTPGIIKILEHKVESETGTSAILKFKEWQNSGKELSFLTDK